MQLIFSSHRIQIHSHYGSQDEIQKCHIINLCFGPPLFNVKGQAAAGYLNNQRTYISFFVKIYCQLYVRARIKYRKTGRHCNMVGNDSLLSLPDLQHWKTDVPECPCPMFHRTIKMLSQQVTCMCSIKVTR